MIKVKRVVKKRGPLPRLYLHLIDGKIHEFDEFYDFVATAINPVMGIRQYQQIYKYRDNSDVSYEKMLEEGRRIRLVDSLRRAEKTGYLRIEWPENEPPRKLSGRGSTKGYFDLRKCKLQLLEKGLKDIFSNKHGVLTRILSELYQGMKADRLEVSVKYQGKPEINLGL